MYCLNSYPVIMFGKEENKRHKCFVDQYSLLYLLFVFIIFDLLVLYASNNLPGNCLIDHIQTHSLIAPVVESKDLTKDVKQSLDISTLYYSIWIVINREIRPNFFFNSRFLKKNTDCGSKS